MYVKGITLNQLKNAISIAFEGDKAIFDLFDPNVKVETLDEIVSNISDKILTYGTCFYIGVFEGAKLIGYFVYKDNQLISFALAVQYRIRKYLREFFRLIKSEIKGHFMVLLWNKNSRGIKYLIKQGMEIINKDQNITQLAY